MEPSGSSGTQVVDPSDLQKTRASLESKYKDLLKENEALDKEIDKLRAAGVTLDLQPQMRALHEYNDMKDWTQTILGYLASVEQVSIAELHRRYDLPLD